MFGLRFRRGAVYLRLQPNRSNTRQARLHKNPLPVKLLKAQKKGHAKNEDAPWCEVSVDQVRASCCGRCVSMSAHIQIFTIPTLMGQSVCSLLSHVLSLVSSCRLCTSVVSVLILLKLEVIVVFLCVDIYATRQSVSFVHI